MGFWDSFKAGFYGAAGVDYYSKKNNAVLREIRDSVSYEPPSQLDAEAGMYLGFLATVAKPVEQAVMVELPKAIAADTLVAWASWARPTIGRAAEAVRTSEPPDVEVEVVRGLYLDALDGYVNAADWWMSGDRASGDRWARHAAAAWERAIDAAEDSFGTSAPTAPPGRRRTNAPTSPSSPRGPATSGDYQRRLRAVQDDLDRVDPTYGRR